MGRFLGVTALIALGLGVLVAAWVLWDGRGDSDIDQVVGGAIILGAATAGAVLLVGVIVSVLAATNGRRR